MGFSDVTSQEQALQLCKEGKLVELFLFPPELGGQKIPQNMTFVPPGIPEIKDQLTRTLIRFFQEGLINSLNVTPEYQGASFVPSKIRIKAWHTEKSGGFEPSIDIW